MALGLAVAVLAFLGIPMEREDEMPLWVQASLGIGMATAGLVCGWLFFWPNSRLMRRGVVVDAVVVSDGSPLGTALLGGGAENTQRGLRRTHNYDFRGKTYEGYFDSHRIRFSLRLGAVLPDPSVPDWTGRRIQVLVDPKRPAFSKVLE